MATEAEIIPEPIALVKTEEEIKHLTLESCDKVIDFPPAELSQPAETIECLAKAENMQAASSYGVKTINNVSEGNPEISKGESFLESPEISKVANETHVISEHTEVDETPFKAEKIPDNEEMMVTEKKSQLEEGTATGENEAKEPTEDRMEKGDRDHGTVELSLDIEGEKRAEVEVIAEQDSSLEKKPETIEEETSRSQRSENEGAKTDENVPTPEPEKEASDEMKREEEPTGPTPEGNISEIENIDFVKHSQQGKQVGEGIQKESFQQQNQPEKETLACPLNAVYEDANAAISTENAETNTCIREAASIKDHEERFEGEGMENTQTNTDAASENAESKQKDVQIEVNENNETVQVEIPNKNADYLHVADSLMGQSVEKENEKHYFSNFQPEEQLHEANVAYKEKEENSEDISDALQSRNSTNSEHIFTEAAATTDLKSETSEMDKEIVKDGYLLDSEKCSESNETLEKKREGIRKELEDCTAEKPELEDAMENIEDNSKQEETKEVCKGPNSTIKEECAIIDESTKSSEKEMHDSRQEDQKEETPEAEVCEKLEINTVEDDEKQTLEGENDKDQTILRTETVEEKSKEENTAAIISTKEVCEESETAASTTAKENPEIGEHPVADISNSSISDKTVKGNIEEDKSTPKKLIEEDSNSNIEETDSTEETTVQNLEEAAEPNNDPSLLDIGKKPKEEITATESKGDLVCSSSFELEESKEDTEEETSVKGSINTADLDSASPAVETGEINIKEAEAEDEKMEINTVLAVEENGLATTEHEGIGIKSAEVDVKPIESSTSCERVKEIPQEDGMHDEVPNAGGEDQMEVTTGEEILEDEVKEYSTMPSEEYDPTPTEERKISVETLEKDQALDEHSETPVSIATDEISMQKEANATLDVPKAEPEDTGKERGHEVKEHLAKEPYVHTEQESGKCSSVSEATNVSNGEEHREPENESDACKVKTLQDEQSSDIGVEREKVEDGKPLDEATGVGETLGTSNDGEKTIEEEENLAKNLAKPESLKEDKEVEKEETELPREAHDLIPDVINVNDNAKNVELALADFEGKPKPNSEPVVEDQSKETFPDPSKSQADETSTDVQNQETERQATVELEDNLDNEDYVNRDQNENEVIKAVIMSDEVDKEFEKSDDSEDIKEHVIEEDSSTNELLLESKGDEKTNEVEDYTSVSTECPKEADSNKQIEVRKSEVEEHLTKDREASLITKESEETRQDEESADPVSVQGEDRVTEEKIEDIVHGSKLCPEKSDIEAATKVKEETSSNNTGVDEELVNTSDMDQHPNNDHELVETKSDVSKTSSADELGKIELASGGDHVSEGNGIVQDAETKKNQTAEEQEANEDEETKASSDHLTQRVETIVEDETLPEEKTEKQLQTSATTMPFENEDIKTPNSIEKIEEEIQKDAGIVKHEGMENTQTNTDAASEDAESKEKDVQIEVNENNETVEVEIPNKNADDLHVADSLMGQSAEKENEKHHFSNLQPEEQLHEANVAYKEKEENSEDISDTLQSRNSTNSEHIFTEAAATTTDLKSETSEMDKEIVKDGYLLDSEKCSESNEALENKQEEIQKELEDCTAEKPELEDAMENIEDNSKQEETKEVCKGPNSTIEEECAIIDESMKSSEKEMHDSCQEDQKEETPEAEVCEKLKIHSVEDDEKQTLEERDNDKDQTILLTEDDEKQTLEEGDNDEGQTILLTETVEEKSKEENTAAIISTKEVCEESETAASATTKENPEMGEHAIADISNSSISDETVKGNIKEDESSPKKLIQEDSNSNIEETDSTEEPTTQNLEEAAEPNNDPSLLDIGKKPKEEITATESKEDLVCSSSFELKESKEDTEEETSVKGSANTADLDSASSAVETGEINIREAEAEDEKKEINNVPAVEENGLATTEHEGIGVKSAEVDVKPIESSTSCERVKEIPQEDGMHDEVPNAGGEDQMEVITGEEILEDEVKELPSEEYDPTPTEERKISDETLGKDQAPDEHSETPVSLATAEISMQKEDNPTLDVPKAEPEDTGKESGHEVKEHLAKEPYVHTEQESGKCSSVSEVTNVSNGEEHREPENESDACKVKTLQDEQSSDIGVEREKVEDGKPLDEATGVGETLGTSNDGEKTIEEEENLAKNLAKPESLKEDKEVEKEETELPREAHDLIPDVINVNDNAKNVELALADFEGKPKPNSEPVVEDQSKETFPDPSKSQADETSTDVQNQETERQATVELEDNLDNEDYVNRDQNENEVIKAVIMSEEVDKEFEKSDDSEDIKEHVIEEDSSTNELLLESKGDEKTNEVEDSTSVSTECPKEADSNKQIEARKSEVEEHLTKDREASLITKESEETRQDEESADSVSVQGEDKVSEEKIEDIVHGSKLWQEKSDIEAATKVKEETSSNNTGVAAELVNTSDMDQHPNNDHELVETKSDVSKTSNADELGKIELASGGDHVSEGNGIIQDAETKKNQTPEEQEANEDEEIKASSDHLTQRVETVVEDETLPEEKTEKQLQTFATKMPSENEDMKTPNSIEEIEEELQKDAGIVKHESLEDSSDTKTNEQVCSQQEEQRENEVVSEEETIVDQGLVKEEPDKHIQTACSTFPSEERKDMAEATSEEIDVVTGDGMTDEQTLSENKSEERTASFALLSKEQNGKTIDEEKINEAEIPEDKISEDSPDANETAETCLETEDVQEPEDVKNDETAAAQAIQVEEPKEQSLTSALPSENIENATAANEKEEEKVQEVEIKEICLEKQRPQDPEAAVGKETTALTLPTEVEEIRTPNSVEKIKEEIQKDAGIIKHESLEDSSKTETKEEVYLQKEEQREPKAVSEEETVIDNGLQKEEPEKQIPSPSSRFPHEEREDAAGAISDQIVFTGDGITGQQTLSTNKPDEGTTCFALLPEEQEKETISTVEKTDEERINEAEIPEEKISEDSSEAKKTADICFEIIGSEKIEEAEFLQDDNREGVSLQKEQLQEDEALVKDENASSQTVPTEKLEEQISSHEHKHETLDEVDKIEEEKVKEEEMQNEDSDGPNRVVEISCEKDETMGAQAALEVETIAAIEEKLVQERDETVGEENEREKTNEENEIPLTEVSKEKVIEAKEIRTCSSTHSEELTKDGSGEEELKYKLIEGKTSEALEMTCQNEECVQKEEPGEQIQTASSRFPSEEKEDAAGATREEIDVVTGGGITDEQTFSENKPEEGTTSLALLSEEHDGETISLVEKIDEEKINGGEIPEDEISQDSPDAKKTAETCLEKEEFQEPEDDKKNETAAAQAIQVEEPKEQSLTSALPSEKIEHGTTASKEEGDEKLKEAEMLEKEICFEKEIPQEPEAVVDQETTAAQASITEESVDNGTIGTTEKLDELDEEKTKEAENLEGEICEDSSVRDTEDICLQKQEQNDLPAVPEEGITSGQTFSEEHSDGQLQISTSATTSPELEHETNKTDDEETKKEEAIKDKISEDASDARTMEEICSQKERSIDLEAVVEDETEKKSEEVQNQTSALSSKEEESGNAHTTEKIESKNTEEEEFLQDDNKENVSLQEEQLREDEALVKDEHASSQTLPTKKPEKKISNSNATLLSEEYKHETVNEVDKAEEEEIKEEKMQNEDSDGAKTEAELCSEKDETRGPQAVLEGETIAGQVIAQEQEEKKIEEEEKLGDDRRPQSECVRELQGALEDGATAAQTFSAENQPDQLHITTSTLPFEEQKDEMKGTELQEDESPEKISDQIEAASNIKMETRERDLDNELVTESEDAANKANLVKEIDEPAREENESEKTKEGSEIILNEVSKDEVIVDEEVTETYYSTSHSEELTKDGSREYEPKYKLIEDKTNEASEITCQNEEGLQKEEPEQQTQTTPAFPYKEREDAAGAISEEADVVTGDGITGEQTLSANKPEEGTPSFALLSKEQEEETISIVEMIDEEKINEAEIPEDKISEDSSDEKKTADMCSEKDEFQEHEDAKKDETAAAPAIQVEETNEQSLTLALPSENIEHGTTANEEDEKVQDICLEEGRPQKPEAVVYQETTIVQASTEESVEIKTIDTAEKLDEEKMKEAENLEDVICEDSSTIETEYKCLQKEEPNELPAAPEEAITSGQTFSEEQSDEQLHISASAITSQELEHETKLAEDEQTDKEEIINDEIQEDTSDARTMEEISSQKDELEAVVEDGIEKKSEEQVQNQPSTLFSKEEEGGNTSTTETIESEKTKETEFPQDDNREDATLQKERVQEDEALVKDEIASSQTLPMEKSEEQISNADTTLVEHKHETVNEVDKTEEEKVKEGETRNEDTDRANTAVETCSLKDEARGPHAALEGEAIASQVIEEDVDWETEEKKIDEGETIDDKKSQQSECARELQGALEDGATAAQTLSGKNQPDQLHLTTSTLPSEEQKDEMKETELQEDESQEKIPEQTREIKDASNVKMETRDTAFDNDLLTESEDAAIEEKLVKERDEPEDEANEREKTNEGSEIILNEVSKEEVIEDKEVTETSYSTSHSEELTKDGSRKDELNYKLIEDKTNEESETTCENEEGLQKEEPEKQIETTPSTFPYEARQDAAGAISEEIDVVTGDGITCEQTVSANKPEEGTPSFALLSIEHGEETVSKVEKIDKNEVEIPEDKISEDSSDAKETTDIWLEKEELQEQIQSTSSTFPYEEREDATRAISEGIAVVKGDGITCEQNLSADKPEEGTISFTLLSKEQKEETISTVEKDDKEKINEAEIQEGKISDGSSDAKKTADICLEKEEFQEAEDAMKDEAATAQAIEEEEPNEQSLTSELPSENIEHGTTANEEQEEKVKEVEMLEKEICLEKERPQDPEAIVDQTSITDESVDIETTDTAEKLDEEKTKEAENLEDEVCEDLSARESEDICFQKEEPNDLHAVREEGITSGQTFLAEHSDEQLHISTSSIANPELELETKTTEDEETNKDKTIKDEILEDASDARTSEEIRSQKERSIELEAVVEDEKEQKSEEQVQIPTSALSSKEQEGGNTNITEKIESEKIEEAEFLQDDKSEDVSLQKKRLQEDEALVKDENASSQTLPTEKSVEQVSNPEATLPSEEHECETVNQADKKTEEEKVQVEEEMRHEDSDGAKTVVEISSANDQTTGPQAVLEGETIASQVIAQESEEKKTEEEETLEDDKSLQSECGRELQDDLEDGATVAQTLSEGNQPDQIHITTSTLPSAEQKDETNETDLQEDKSPKKIPEQISQIEEASNVKMETCEKAFGNGLLTESEDAVIEEKLVKERDETAGEENVCEKTTEEKEIILNEVSKEEVIAHEKVTETSYTTSQSKKLGKDNSREDELVENKINEALETTCQNEEGLQTEEPEKQIQSTPSAFPFEERKDAAGAINEEMDVVTGDGITGDQTLSANKPEGGTPSFALLSKEKEEETIRAVEKIEEDKINEAEIPEDKISEDSSDAKKAADICLQQKEFQEIEDIMKDETAVAQSIKVEEPTVLSLTSALPSENIEHGPTNKEEEEEEEEEKVKEMVMLGKERHQEPEVVVDQETTVVQASITEETLEIETVDKVEKLDEEKPKEAENLEDKISEDSSARDAKEICLQKEEPNELHAVPEEEITSGRSFSEEQSKEQLHISICVITSAESEHETKKTEDEEIIKEEISEDALDARTMEEICSQKERSTELEAFVADRLEKKSEEVQNPTCVLSSKEEGGNTSTTEKTENVKIEEAEFLHDDNGEDVSLQKERVQKDEALVKDESAYSSQTPTTEKTEEQIPNPDAALLSEEHKHEAVSELDKTEEEKVKEEEMQNGDSNGAKTVEEICPEKDETMEPQAVLEGESIASQVITQDSEEKKIEEEEKLEDDKSLQSESQEDESSVKIPEQTREIEEASNVKMETCEKALDNELVTESEDAAIQNKLVKERDEENQCEKTNKGNEIILNEVSKEEVIEEKKVTETSYSTSHSEGQTKDCFGEDEINYKLIEDKTNEALETKCQNEELSVEAQQSTENDSIEKQIISEHKIVEDPGEASVARIETATVTEEESRTELPRAEGTKELAEGYQIIDDTQQPEERTNIASDDQISRALDPIEIIEIRSSIGQKHAPTDLQYRITESSQKTAELDVKVIYPKEANVDHSGEKTTDNSGEDITKESTLVEDAAKVSSSEHVESSPKEIWQVTQDMIEEREAKGQTGAAQVLLEKPEEQSPAPSSKLPYEEGEHRVSTQVNAVDEKELKEVELLDKESSDTKTVEEICMEKEEMKIKAILEQETIAVQAPTTEIKGDPVSHSEDGRKEDELKDERIGGKTNETLKVPTSTIQNEELSVETLKDGEKENFAEDEAVMVPDQAPVGMKEATIVREEIPGEADATPTESSRTTSTICKENLPTELQDKALEISEKDEAGDLEPGNAQEICSQPVIDHGEEQKTDTSGVEITQEPASADSAKLSLSDLLQRSTRDKLQVSENVIEERELTVSKEESYAEGAENKVEGEEGDDHNKTDTGSDAPVMVEAPRDTATKVHKKSHNILSSVGSKVKHSISKVKKAITGKSSHSKESKPISPKGSKK